MAMYPRPDQIPRFKNLGIMTSGWDLAIWEAGQWGRQILQDYGERGAMQVVPRKSLYDAGIMNSVEIDRALAATNLTYFNVLYSGITRKDQDGQTLAPQQAIDRRAMLKSATLWAAYGVKREDVLGSLEPGKWADLVVLDKDYLTLHPLRVAPWFRWMRFPSCGF
jgi:predicted amidohydrolase YtcJ